MIEESGTDSGMTPPPTKRIFRKKKFCQTWLENPTFSSWLAECEDDQYKAKCLACNKTLQAGKNELLKHSNTQLHARMLSRMQSGGESESEVPSTSMSSSDRVKRAEIIYVLDIIEHSRSFNSYSHFAKMTSRAGCDSDVLSKITLKRTKISAITKNVINKTVTSKMAAVLRNNVFSILVGESAEATDNKNLCYLAQFVHEGKTQTYLIDYFQIKEDRGEYLYKCFKHSMEKYKLPVNNIIGVCIDNASIMLEKQTSFVSRLTKETHNEIAVFSHICHSMHLVACDACKKLPNYVEYLLHMLYHYFSRSDKRLAVLEEIQQVINMAKQRAPSRRRWLGVAHYVERIMSQWNVLHEFFAAEATVEMNLYDGIDGAASLIYKRMNCLYTKAYLHFVNYALKIFTKFNTLFQSNNVLIHGFMEECNQFLRLLACNFMHTEVIKANDLHSFDPFDVDSLLPLQEINIGQHARNIIEQLKADDKAENDINDFYKNCLLFYQEAFRGAVRRLPFNDAFLTSLAFLLPKNALNTNKSQDDLKVILEKFPSKINREEAIDEWRLLPYQFPNNMVEELKKLDVCQFWETIRSAENHVGDPKFANIYRVAQICMSLPTSNAEIERFLSLLNETRTRDRNRLKSDTVAAIARIRLHLRNTNTNCTDYPISNKMLQLMSSDMYKKESVPRELRSIVVQDEGEDSDSDVEAKRTV